MDIPCADHILTLYNPFPLIGWALSHRRPEEFFKKCREDDEEHAAAFFIFIFIFILIGT
jgi:hypothetical protein